MRILRCEAGAALVTALMLTMLSLVIALALLSTITMGTRISASQKRYRSALAAAHGGVELMTQEIIPRLLQTDPLNTTQDGIKNDLSPVNLQLPQSGCLQQKLNTPTNKWNAACSSSADPTQSPDVTFRLSGSVQETGFNVSAKIVDAEPGNSDKSFVELLDVGMSASGRDEVIHPQHVPALYNLSVQGVREGGGSREKALLSVLYAY